MLEKRVVALEGEVAALRSAVAARSDAPQPSASAAAAGQTKGRFDVVQRLVESERWKWHDEQVTPPVPADSASVRGWIEKRLATHFKQRPQSFEVDCGATICRVLLVHAQREVRESFISLFDGLGMASLNFPIAIEGGLAIRRDPEVNDRLWVYLSRERWLSAPERISGMGGLHWTAPQQWAFLDGKVDAGPEDAASAAELGSKLWRELRENLRMPGVTVTETRCAPQLCRARVAYDEEMRVHIERQEEHLWRNLPTPFLHRPDPARRVVTVYTTRKNQPFPRPRADEPPPRVSN